MITSFICQTIGSFFVKIDLSKIARDHVASLKRTRETGESYVSKRDIFIFYILPTILGFLSYRYIPPIKTETYNTSISVFAIFGALLFSAQVAMFGLIRKSPSQELNETDKHLDKDQRELERKLLIEVNSSISYLISLSCISISILLVLSALNSSGAIITGLLISIYCHFFLTAAMLIKRSHALFDNAYKRA